MLEDDRRLLKTTDDTIRITWPPQLRTASDQSIRQARGSVDAFGRYPYAFHRDGRFADGRILCGAPRREYYRLWKDLASKSFVHAPRSYEAATQDLPTPQHKPNVPVTDLHVKHIKDIAKSVEKRITRHSDPNYVQKVLSDRRRMKYKTELQQLDESAGVLMDDLMTCTSEVFKIYRQAKKFVEQGTYDE